MDTPDRFTDEQLRDALDAAGFPSPRVWPSFDGTTELAELMHDPTRTNGAFFWRLSPRTIVTAAAVAIPYEQARRVFAMRRSASAKKAAASRAAASRVDGVTTASSVDALLDQLEEAEALVTATQAAAEAARDQRDRIKAAHATAKAKQREREAALGVA